MKRQLDSRSIPVEDLFAPPFLFASPAFQRSFSWTADEAERLLNDLKTAAAGAPGDIYFIGAILLVRLPLPGDPVGGSLAETIFSGPERTFDIIDGQQRIATLAILLAVMRDLLRRHGAPTATGIATTGIATHERLQHALTPKPALAPQPVRATRVRLRGGDGVFLEHATAEAGACLVPPLAPTATEAQERMIAIRDYFVGELEDLEPAELERFALFMLENCALVAVVTNTIDRAYQMFTVLNGAGKPLTRNDILKAELIGAIPGADRGRATEAWDALAEQLGGDFEQLFSFVTTEAGRGSLQILDAVRAQVAATPSGAAGFVFETLLPAGRIVATILSAQHAGAPQSARINQALRHLGWLPGQEWVAPLLAFWKRHAADPEALLMFVSALDRFAYGVRLLALGNDKRAQRMAAVTRAIAAGTPSRGPWLQLQFNRDELRNINFGLRDLHRRSPHICRLVLQRLEEQMSGRPLNVGDKTLTVEHILPLKVPPQSAWKTDFPDADARGRLSTCLGNLTLVVKDVNEAASNHDFIRKHAIYFGPKAQPIPILTAELRGVTAWTPALIEARLERMTRGFNEIWRFDQA